MPARVSPNDAPVARADDPFALWCAAHLDVAARADRAARGGGGQALLDARRPVSYTHLTLPTILLV